MKRLFHKVIDFFDYFFYRATKTMVFNKDLDGKVFGGRCCLSVLSFFLIGIVLWPLLGLFTDYVTGKQMGYIIIVLELVLLLFSGKRYSNVQLFKKLDKKYNNEPHSVLRGFLLWAFVAIIVTLSALLLKYCVNVR